jgi:hypothetical protein
MEYIRKLFFGYQKIAWYVNQAKGEYAKFGSFIPETLTLMTYLSVKGIEIRWWYVPLFYGGIMVIAGILGWFLAYIGVVKYNNSLANSHNEEISEILKILKEKR